MNTRNLILSDIYRYYGNWKFITILKSIVSPTVRYQIIFRMCQGDNIFGKWCGRILMFFSFTKRRIQIPLDTKIGYGLYIGHGGPVVINEATEIGNNCNISQFVTIGSNADNGAIIGNNCYIGPNVCIVGNVHIGENVTIGAGSVVTKDIPSNATAAGNYARVLNYNNPGRFIHNLYTTEKNKPN